MQDSQAQLVIEAKIKAAFEAKNISALAGFLNNPDTAVPLFTVFSSYFEALHFPENLLKLSSILESLASDHLARLFQWTDEICNYQLYDKFHKCEDSLHRTQIWHIILGEAFLKNRGAALSFIQQDTSLKLEGAVMTWLWAGQTSYIISVNKYYKNAQEGNQTFSSALSHIQLFFRKTIQNHMVLEISDSDSDSDSDALHDIQTFRELLDYFPDDVFSAMRDIMRLRNVAVSNSKEEWRKIVIMSLLNALMKSASGTSPSIADKNRPVSEWLFDISEENKKSTYYREIRRMAFDEQLLSAAKNKDYKAVGSLMGLYDI